MKVLFISHSPLLYGAELGLFELARGLSESNAAEPGVVFPYDGPLVGRLKHLGIPTWIVPYSRWATGPASIRRKLELLLQNARAVRPLVRLMRSEAWDVVVTSTVTIPSGAFAARLAGIPHIWGVMEYPDPAYGVGLHWGHDRTLRLVNRLSRVVVVPSSGLRDYLSRWIPDDRIRVLQAPTETPEGGHAPPDGNPLRLVSIGQKSPGKGQEDAIRAVACLRRRGIDAILSLVGSEERDYGATLRRIAGEEGVSGAVRFIDHTEDPFAYLETAQVAISCSRREALGRLVIEAMKYGRPVVGARAPGTTELINDGWNGLLYRPGEPEDLAEKISLLHGDAELSHRLTETARSWASKEFTMEAYMDQFKTAVGAALHERTASSLAV
jgi:glycosyltransferase involved in cell wall biosynthesis